jgi:hypothetical protein
MSTLVDRHRTTMSDSDVASLPARDPYASGSMSDDDVVLARRAMFPFGAWRHRVPGPYGAGARARALDRLVDNWDGHYAYAPRAEVIERAEALLDGLPRGMPLPDVSASTDGGVILEWDQTGVSVLVVLGLTDVEVSVELDGVVSEGPLGAVESALVAALARVAAGS